MCNEFIVFAFSVSGFSAFVLVLGILFKTLFFSTLFRQMIQIFLKILFVILGFVRFCMRSFSQANISVCEQIMMNSSVVISLCVYAAIFSHQK